MPWAVTAHLPQNDAFLRLTFSKIPYKWCITRVDVPPEVWSIQVPIFSCGIGRVARIFGNTRTKILLPTRKLTRREPFKRGTVFSKSSKQQFFWSKHMLMFKGATSKNGVWSHLALEIKLERMNYKLWGCPKMRWTRMGIANIVIILYATCFSTFTIRSYIVFGQDTMYHCS